MEFNEELAKKLERQSEIRRNRSRAILMARNYKSLFIKMTTHPITKKYEETFNGLIEQFGEIKIQESVEYMYMKNSNGWYPDGFFSYLIKILQGNRRNTEDNYQYSIEDKYINDLSAKRKEESKRLTEEATRWLKKLGVNK